MKHPSLILIWLFLAVSMALSCAEPEVFNDQARMDEAVRMNHIQVVGSHNSYKSGIREEILEIIWEEDPGQAQSLDYRHPDLEKQLDLGVRKLELDVFSDPQGGLFSNPQGIEEATLRNPDLEFSFDPQGELNSPGFKVFHIQDVDFESHCLLLENCLATLRNWSDRHPNHLPIVITFNAKDLEVNVEGMTKPVSFDKATFQALDQALFTGLSKEKMITPDDLRVDGLSLNQSILKSGWPSLFDSRGKFLLVLDEKGDKRQRYLDKNPSLEGRAMFVNSDEGLESAAFFIINDPIAEEVRIRSLVKEGYMVRTRADAGTIEARNNDTSRMDKAFEIGAHVVSTDYYIVDPKIGTDFIVEIPDGIAVARCNPISAPEICNNNFLE